MNITDIESAHQEVEQEYRKLTAGIDPMDADALTRVLTSQLGQVTDFTKALENWYKIQNF